LTISADDIQSAIEEYVESFTADTSREEVGTVIDAGDGIAHVEGLPSVMTQELLEFPGGILGVALNLDEHSIGAVILGDFANIQQGQQVKRTGEVLSCPSETRFSAGWSTRWVNQSTGAATSRRHAARARTAGAVGGGAAERERAPADRDQGHRRNDPDRRGQRQLIIGDRKTGKTRSVSTPSSTSARTGRLGTPRSRCAAYT